MSVAYFKKTLPKIKVIKNPGNFGFAKGNNVGVKYALKEGATHILIINPDVVVDRTFFNPLLKDLESDKKIMLAAPAIRHEQNGIQFYGLDGKVDWKTAKATHTNLRWQPKDGQLIEAQFVTFACVLMKKEVFDKVGLLDDSFFMYLEDVDYCLKVKKAGFRIVLDPAVVVDHETSSSFARPTDKLLISFRSQLLFINKWLVFPKNVFPLVYTLIFYPYLYLLWTYHGLKHRK